MRHKFDYKPEPKSGFGERLRGWAGAALAALAFVAFIVGGSYIGMRLDGLGLVDQRPAMQRAEMHPLCEQAPSDRLCWSRNGEVYDGGDLPLSDSAYWARREHPAWCTWRQLRKILDGGDVPTISSCVDEPAEWESIE